MTRASQSSTDLEGVYPSGDGFGAELQKGTKRLRQDGFRSAAEAAAERARWTKSLEEGKGRAPDQPAAKRRTYQQDGGFWGAGAWYTSGGGGLIHLGGTPQPPGAAPRCACDGGVGRMQTGLKPRQTEHVERRWLARPLSNLEGWAAAAERAAAAPPLTSKEARKQEQAEGLTLRVAENKTGYHGVYLQKPSQPKPFQVRGRQVTLGYFATAEEAALSVARSPEGRAAQTVLERAASHMEEGRETTIPSTSNSWDEHEQQMGSQVTSEVAVPHQRGGTSDGGSTCNTVEEKLARHVMSNYTPRAPGELQMKLWASCAQLQPAQLQPLLPDHVKQLITNQNKDHPAFAGHPFNAWCKMLKDFDAPAGSGRRSVMKFCFEYTPNVHHSVHK